MPSGETRCYRVGAYPAGMGVWSDLSVATTVSGVPDAPSLSASRANQGSGADAVPAIPLTLNHPRDNGRTFFASDISRADYDQVAWTCGTDWQYLDRMGDQKFRPAAAPQEYLDTGDFGDALEPGAYRCYQVRAFNGAEANNGQGTWSNVAQASAGGEAPPEWGKCGASRTARPPSPCIGGCRSTTAARRLPATSCSTQ